MILPVIFLGVSAVPRIVIAITGVMMVVE